MINELPQVWQEKWANLGFKIPSLIQEKTFEPLKKKQNVLGISPTGSGKTLAYVLPLLLQVEQQKGNQILILAPSQELAVQIHQVVREFAKQLQLKSQLIIGGANSKRQIEKLKQKPEVIVGTPGRILELIKMKKIKSHLFKAIVLDEVDHLFQSQELNLTKQIIKSVPKEVQRVFFSATAQKVIPEAQKLAEDLTVIDVTVEDNSAGKVTHYYLQLSPRKKSEYLRKCAYLSNFQAMVFFNQLNELGTVEEKLIYEGVPVVSLASDQSKMLRKLAIERFTKKQATMLLTTDIAARGLDFQAIPFVINAEVPLSEESYIHRAGRVGRMGATGVVVTFVNDATKRDYQRLMKATGYTYQKIFLYNGQLQEEAKQSSKEISPKKRLKK